MILSRISNQNLLIALFAITKLCLHLFTSTNYELHGDAFLYYSLGKHLDWGYASTAPLIALLSSIATFIFGDTTFALRFFPAVFGGISVIFIAKIVMQLKGGSWAIIISSLAFIASPAYLRVNSLFQPVFLNQFFWLLFTYYFIKLLNSKSEKYWIYIGITFGLAFLNKYSIAFLGLAFFVTISLSDYRRIIISKYFLLAIGIAGLIMTPNLIWQYEHAWPVVTHMTELKETQLNNNDYFGFLIAQLIMNLPGIIVWLTGLLVFLLKKEEKRFRVIAIVFLLTIAIIALLQGKPYYTLGIYTTLLAFGGYAIEKYFSNILKYGVLIFCIFISIIMLPLSLPILTIENLEEYSKPSAEFTNRWEDGKIYNIPQDFADMNGRKDLLSIVINTYNQLSENEKRNCAVYTESYSTAGAILFYGEKHNLPEPICFHDSFLFWAPDSLNSTVIIYINNNIADLKQLFDDVQIIEQYQNKYSRENGNYIAICRKPKAILPDFYANKVTELKKRYKKQ